MWGVRRMTKDAVTTPVARDAEAGHLDKDHGGKDDNDKMPVRTIFGMPAPLFSGICYCAASGSMVLLNKHALSGFSFTAPNALLFFQCALAVILVKICEFMGLVQLQPLKRDLVSVWFPVNIIFVGMIGSSFYALKHVGVGMVTIWKNLSNFVTAIGDLTIYGKRYSVQVWICLGLMMLSAVVGAGTDARFTWIGYMWQAANCILTSAYALYLRSVMDKVAEYTTNKQKMDEFSMVYYNNLLSLPLILILMYGFGEFDSLFNQPALNNPIFLAVGSMGGIIGFLISFSSLWFLSQTTATIYSLVGALNKIPVAIVGLFAFHEPTNPKNLASIIIGLAAGVVFAYAKSKGR